MNSISMFNAEKKLTEHSLNEKCKIQVILMYFTTVGQSKKLFVKLNCSIYYSFTELLKVCFGRFKYL